MEGSSRQCPPGKIRRVPYTRKNGVRVKSSCVKDMGAVGRWQTIKRMAGIGPLKHGHLKNLGYDPMAPASKRHEAIDKSVKRYGKVSTLRKLNAIATYTKRTNPSRSKTYRTDVHYVQKFHFKGGNDTMEVLEGMKDGKLVYNIVKTQKNKNKSKVVIAGPFETLEEAQKHINDARLLMDVKEGK